jgi:hypothetical protein
VPHGHELSDHPAHRGADHVHAVQAECLQQADRVVGQIGEPVGDRGRVAAEYGHDVGGPAESRCVESPMSRLSNRTTKWPRPASPAQKSSGHPIICVARPMTRSTGGSPAFPKVS